MALLVLKHVMYLLVGYYLDKYEETMKRNPGIHPKAFSALPAEAKSSYLYRFYLLNPNYSYRTGKMSELL